jgi:hypothetical protein
MTEEQEPNQEPRLKPIDILNGMNSDAPVFVGFSPRGPVNEPFEIKRWGQFIVKFGSFKKCGYLATSMNGFFGNGGKRCYVLNLGERPVDLEDLTERFTEGLKSLDGLDDIPFILAPGESELEIHDAILTYCEQRGTFALLDGPEGLVEKVVEPEEPDVGEVVSEEYKTAPEAEPDIEAKTEGAEPEAEAGEDEKYVNMPEVIGKAGTVIYPWIYLKDRVLGDFYIPPTGHIAGILCRLYAGNDRPKFSDIKGTVLLKYKFSSEDIEKYKVRGISFLKYPTKAPGLILE